MRLSRGKIVAIFVILLLVMYYAVLVQHSPQVNRVTQEIVKNPDTALLPYFVMRTLIRMWAAYALVVVFGLSYGIIAGMYRTPRRVMVPLLDIMQSIPVLGYLPAAVLFFMNLLPGIFGQELAAILLIFTGEAWAVTFSVYGGVRSIPNDLREASKAFGMTGWRYIRHVVLPAIFPPFITGSILAWGGGWYFLVACEFMTFGSKHYELPGIGYYIAKSVFIYNNIPAASFGLVVFAGVVYLMNWLVWKPLSAYAERFKCQTMESPLVPSEGDTPVLWFIEWVARRRFIVDNVIDFVRARWDEQYRKVSKRLDKIYVPRPRMHISHPFWKQFSIYTILFAVVIGAVALFVAYSLQKPLVDLKLAMDTHPESYMLPEYAVFSVMRIFVAYVLALTWTLGAAILITRSKKLSAIFFPLFDIGQSIPALALFPFLMVIVIRLFGGGGLGLEIASVLLLMTGTQWYLLFNIIGAIRAIPGDIVEASRSFGIRDVNFIRYVLLPAIFPGLVLGSIQAWGGAWNASIVSEYVMYGRALDVNLTYENVTLAGARASLDGTGTELKCGDGVCSGSIVAEKTGNNTLSISASAADGSVSTASVAFLALEEGEKEKPGSPLSFALGAGTVSVVSPEMGASAPLHPNVYSVKGLGYFLDKATAEWGNPSLVALTIAVMSITIILLNHFVWGRMFAVAERYKFEMT